MSNTGKLMKLERERVGLTTSDVAAKMGFSRSALTKWEIGTSLPPVDAIERWATALNVEKEIRSAVLTLRKWEKLGGN
jgi:transcriptional regulator with XRE-family HTH domain|tara:strand:- start:1427 stop:1660 length:234 start_codon:yes stop_codon:yes gene_type:complete